MDARINSGNGSVKLHVLPSPDLAEAVLFARAGNRVLLLTSRPVPSGALVETEISGATVLGEVINCVPSGDQFEIWIEISHSLSVHWRPHPTWIGVPETVLDSLTTLNRRLAEASTEKSPPPVRDLGLAKLAAAVSKTSNRLRRIVRRRLAS